MAQERDSDAAAADVVHTIFVDASINGIPKGMIIELQLANDRLYALPADLLAIGIDPGGVPPDAQGRVALDEIPGLRYSYSPQAQTIDVQVAADHLVVEELGYQPAEAARPQGATGFVMNYHATLQLNSTDPVATRALLLKRNTASSLYNERSIFRMPDPLTSRAIAPLDGHPSLTRSFSLYTDSRLFMPSGTFYNSGFGVVTDTENTWTRTDTNWTHSNTDTLRTLLVGDFITTTTVSQARAVRLGGIQFRSNFDMRPDLVTFPIPQLSGSAVVPSAVDLYINNVRQFTGQASGGPFQIATLPALTGAGTATIVVRDALGREITTSVPLYVDTRLWEKGLTDFAIEAGYFRRNYGVDSSEYSSAPGFNGSWIHGVTDAWTVAVHGEATSGVANAGGGSLVKLGRFGVLGAWLSGSGGDGRGSQYAMNYQYYSPRWSINVDLVETRDDYRDLGTAEGTPMFLRTQRGTFALQLTPAQSVTVGYTRTDTSPLFSSRIVSLGYSASIGSRFSVFAQAFEDLEAEDAYGAYVGVSVNLGRHINLYSSISKAAETKTVSLGASKPADYDVGGFGWSVQVDDSDGDYSHALVSGDYRGDHTEVQATAETFNDASLLTLETKGALVVMDRAILASRPIYDSCAVVSTDGVAGVPVVHENRIVGVTNRNGHYVVPDLQAYHSNRIGIDAEALPATARVRNDEVIVVPGDKAGALARFVLDAYTGASIILIDAQGEPLPVGTRVTLQGSEGYSLVGYDGLVFFESLSARNQLVAEFRGRACTVEVPFEESQAMTTIGPFVCDLRAVSL